jgi:hypothetical protein
MTVGVRTAPSIPRAGKPAGGGADAMPRADFVIIEMTPGISIAT